MSFWQDFRHSVRGLRRSPWFALVAISILALGIGASTAIYSVLDSALLRPLPYDRADDLTVLWWASPAKSKIPLALADLRDWREQSSSFSALEAYHPWEYTLTGGDRAERVSAAVMTAGMFDLLGAEPALGRGFEADGPGTVDTVILSHGLWQRRYGGDPQIIGQTLIFDDQPVEVLGVMPEGFRFPLARPAETWRPILDGPDSYPRATRYLRVLGRLAPGVSLAAARAELGAVSEQMAAEYPDTNTDLESQVVPLRETVVKDFRQALMLLQVAVLLALMIACSNVAVLQLARATRRQGEVAVRLALGASRSQVMRFFLLDSLVLSLAGGALGVVLGAWGVELLVRFGPSKLYGLDQTRLDLRVLAFALGLTLLSGLVFGLVPALRWRRSSPSQALRTVGRGATDSMWLRQTFVFLQVAITLVLLIGAGLLIRSLAKLSNEPAGFRTSGLLTLLVTLPEGQANIETTSSFYRQAAERITSLPGVSSFATSVSLPLAGGMSVGSEFDIEGRSAADGDPKRYAQVRPVSPGFFATLGIPLIAGRDFTPQDDSERPGVVLINQELARLFFAGSDPLGEQLLADIELGTFGRFAQDKFQVIGVVGDIKTQGLDREVQPEIYFSTLQGPWIRHNLIVRTAGAPSALAKPVVDAIQTIDPSLPVVDVRSMEQTVAEALGEPRFNTWLLGIFAAFALALTVLGLYGALSYSVHQRRREIGLRMALGARRRDVLWQVVRRGLLVTLAGLTAGLVGAFFMVRLLAGLLFGVGSTDPTTFVAVCALLLLVALVASYLPARRAARLDPMTTLRYE